MIFKNDFKVRTFNFSRFPRRALDAANSGEDANRRGNDGMHQLDDGHGSGDCEAIERVFDENQGMLRRFESCERRSRLDRRAGPFQENDRPNCDDEELRALREHYDVRGREL